ncbi:MAG: 2-hydroxyacyl-CoA dehydratase [Acidobacteriota bacterium]
MATLQTVEALVEVAEAHYRDSALDALARVKERGLAAVGCAPAYVPAEIIDAAGAVPVSLLGAGPSLEVVQGDAYFQSAICHLPRSLVELGLRGALAPLSLVVVPSTCDVLRNLTGMWQLLFPAQRVRFLDLPQRYDAEGFAFYRRELAALAADVSGAVGAPIAEDGLREAIARGNRRRRIVWELETMRDREPWRVRTSDFWLAVRVGAVMTPSEHVAFLEAFLDASRRAERPPLDVARVVVTGAFCEQPPLGFLRTLERAGCAIVSDDLLLGMRWLRVAVDETGDPLDALARAYLEHSPLAPCRYEGHARRGDAIVAAVRRHEAAGVIYATPSFCDPALLDRPAILAALERAGIPCVQLQYAENSVDFGSVREQAGTFADALRLWEVA